MQPAHGHRRPAFDRATSKLAAAGSTPVTVDTAARQQAGERARAAADVEHGSCAGFVDDRGVDVEVATVGLEHVVDLRQAGILEDGVGHGPDRGASRTTPARENRAASGSSAVFVGLVVATLAPTIVAALSLLGRHWHPAADLAIQVLQIDDVGGRHTPLTGAHSRYGWDHPGPLLFWLLAPFDWLFGTTGILVGVAVLNAAAIVGALVVARRRGGVP